MLNVKNYEMLQQMCRTCLATCGELVPIFSEDYYVHNLPAKLFHTIRIEVQKDDELPKMMCKKCIFLVDSLFCFKDQCEMAEIKLRKTITDGNHSDAFTSSEEDYDVEYASEEARLEVENARRRSRNAKKKRNKNIGVKVKSVEIVPVQRNDNNCKNLSPMYTNDITEITEELVVSESDDRSSFYLSEGSKSFRSYSEEKKNYFRPSKSIDNSNILQNSKCDEDQEDLPLKPVFKRKLDSDSDYSQLSKVPKKVIFKDNGFVDDDIQFIEVTDNQSHLIQENSTIKVDNNIDAINNKKIDKIENYRRKLVSTFEISDDVPIDDQTKKILNLRIKTLISQLVINYPEVCHICSKFFASYSDALRHKIEFHLSSIENCFDCPVCQERFLTMIDILEHLNKHVNVRGFLCLLCSDSFYTDKNLRIHLYSHMDLQKLKCKICNKNFLRIQGLLNHILEHVVNKPLSCILCTNTFENKDSLQSHIDEEHQKPQKELSSNETEEHAKIAINYPCPYCEQSFSLKTALRDHVFTHLGVQQYSCLVCEKSFNSQEERTKHVQEHMMPNQKKDCKKFRCRVCHEILISRVAYGQHLKEKHWNAKHTSEILKELSETSMTEKVNEQCPKNCTSLISNSIRST